jgi:outer membrane protein OmpA-like peptidoglycan-associated protein
MPVAAAAMLDFTPGSAALPQSPASLIAWARAAAADPRVTLKVAGETDGSAADIDPASGSRAVLAADRARAVAAALAEAHVVQPGRLTIVNAPDRAGKGRRAVLVTLGFAGERQ